MSDPRKAYYVYRARHPQTTDITLDEFVLIYRMGGRHALQASAEFVDLVPKMRELIWWFEASTEEEVQGSIYYLSPEDEQRAVDWALSNANAEEHALIHQRDED